MATPLYDLTDRILNGRLATTLQEWRGEGLSYEGMARRLGTEHHIEVSGQAVRNWCHDIGATERGAKAAS